MTKYSKIKQFFCEHEHRVIIARIPEGIYVCHQRINHEIVIYQCLTCGKRFIPSMSLTSDEINFFVKSYQTYQIQQKNNQNDYTM